MHDHAFDQVTRYHRWIALRGEHGYSLVLWVSGWLSWWRRSLGLAGDWSLSDFIKRRMQSALRFIHEFEQAVARHASERGFDGVICGHIYTAALKEIEGVTYLNCGDRVESCTALLENTDSQLELIHWDR